MGTQEAVKGLPISGRASLDSDPTRNFRFLVTFQPYGDHAEEFPMKDINFGFTSVAGLSMAVESIPYREGGMNTTLHQVPGQATFSPITLTRGIHLGNSQGWRWIKRLFAAVGPAGVSDVGYPAYQFRTSVTIHVLQHPLNMANDPVDQFQESNASSRNDAVSISFRVYNAWITSLAYSDLNAGDNAIMVEQMTLVHEGMDMYWENTLGEERAQYDQGRLESGVLPPSPDSRAVVRR
jgi:phage tail-like protein